MKSCCLIFVLILFISTAQSQNMNWNNGKITFADKDKVQAVEYGGFTTFKIDDINMFLYSVTISGHRIDLQTPIPTELQTLFRLPSSQLATTANNQAVKSAITATEGLAKRSTEFKASITRENNNAEAFNKKKSKKQTAKKVNKRLQDAAGSFDDELKVFLEKAKKVSNNIEQIKLARIKLVNLAQRDITYAAMDTELGSVTVPASPSQDYQELLDAYNKVQEQYDDVLAAGGDTTELDTLMDKMKKTLKVIQDENPLTLYADVDFLKTELGNKKNFTAIAPPVQADGDFVNYNVAVTPSRTNTLGAYKSPSTFDFDIPVKGGFKTDFSVGPTFSFFDGAKDEKYYFEASDTDGKVILKERKNRNFLSPGLAAMMHFYKRSGTDVSWGGMMGIGAGFQSIEDADLSFYTGMSVILGKSQKIIVSSGLSFLRVDRLKEGEYSVDNEYDESSSINDVTEKVFKPSFFLSLSYNLTNRSSR